MKILVASDIHGDLTGAKAVFEAAEREGADKILLLGDLLYHGPRNDLPATYSPKAVIELLNSNKDRIIAVRGNCDTEVDQMVLEFPILADYALIYADGLTVFATHGHHHNTQAPPPLGKGEVLLHGHTHVLKSEAFGQDNIYLNPGSVSLPKEGNPKTYAVLENRVFTVKELDGTPVFNTNL